MSHRSMVTTIVIDVTVEQHSDEVAFWSGATGKDLVRLSYPEFHGARLTSTLVMLVQELGEGAPRVHGDNLTDWAVMRDPAGLPFCVVKAPPGELDDGAAITWH